MAACEDENDGDGVLRSADEDELEVYGACPCMMGRGQLQNLTSGQNPPRKNLSILIVSNIQEGSRFHHNRSEERARVLS